MKKLAISFLFAGMLAMSSCSSDQPKETVANNDVTFAIEMPAQIGSRAISDGLSALDLTWAVYDASGNFLFQEEKAPAFENRQATVTIPLVNGKTYTIGFFAKNSAAPYTITNGVLNIDYSAAPANDDNYDAFYKAVTITVSADMGQQTITLTRPFAQVNVGATDWELAKRADYLVEQSSLDFTAEVYTAMSLYDGSVSNEQVVKFTMATLPEATVTGGKVSAPGTLTVAGNDYAWMTMAYVLVPATQQTVTTVSFNFTGINAATPAKINVNQVPVQRNYRTNLLGKFFTNDIEYKVIIDEAFEDPDNVVDYPQV